MMCKSGSVLHVFTDELGSLSDIKAIALPKSNNLGTHTVNLSLSSWIVRIKVRGPCGDGDHPALAIVSRCCHSKGHMIVRHHGDTGISINDHVVTARIGPTGNKASGILCGGIPTSTFGCVNDNATTKTVIAGRVELG
jgi:hypothetical protein